MKRTSLYNKHLELGARITSFAGFEMPMHYSGIIDEHQAVRKKVGIFDLSHMGEFRIEGEEAETFLQKMTTNNISLLDVGQAQYTAMCYEDGGFVDDCVLYRVRDGFLLVVNAANIRKDLRWLQRHISGGVGIADISDETSLIAVQGPESLKVLLQLADDPDSVSKLSFYHHGVARLAGDEVLCARTGYTGELGYELYVDAANAERLWDQIMDAGALFGIKPVGLGARDTLRLEMGYRLYGNDIDETVNPLEAGLGWITKLVKDDFVGKRAIQQLKSDGISRKLVGLEMLGRNIPRRGYSISVRGEEIGTVTSGTYSPSLKKGVGMGYVKVKYGRIGTEIGVSIRGKWVPARIVSTPFWKGGTAMQVTN